MVKFLIFNFFVCFVLFCFCLQGQEDSNALKKGSFKYDMQKLQGFKVSFVSDLKPALISDDQGVYILLIHMYLCTRFLGLSFVLGVGCGHTYLSFLDRLTLSESSGPASIVSFFGCMLFRASSLA